MLRRNRHDRMLGGVASGLSDFLDIDPVIVRIAFVALAVLGGSGVLLYVAGWLLVPAQDTGRAVVQDYLGRNATGRRPRRRSLVAIVLGTVIAIVAISNLFSSGPWWPHWDGGFGGFGFFFGLFGLALAGVLLVASGRRQGSPVRWLALTAVVGVVAVVVVAAATVFSIEALSGVPLRGGVGDQQWRPTTVSQVAPHYRLAIGTMEVDLRNVDFGPGTTHVTATVGIGHLVVRLPAGTTVSVSAHSGAGDVQVFGQDHSGLSTVQNATVGNVTVGNPTVGNGGPRIVLDAETGVGQVQVTRGGS